MKKIYLVLLIVLAVATLKASPDIYAPTLVEPANNATKIMPDITLDWQAVTGQIGLIYEIQLDTTSAFTNPQLFTTDLTSYQMSLLSFNEVYFWRVRAVDNSGSSDWSEVRNFTTVSTVVIRKPSDGALSVAPNVQIIWEPITGVSHVAFQIDVVDTFDSPMMTITTAPNASPYSTNASSLHFNQLYYLRMRAYHAADTSEWSVSRSFTVTNTLGVTTPANAATGLSPDVEFKWNKVDGLIKYQLQISIDPTLNQYEAYNVPPTVLKTKPDTLLFGTTYYWQLAGMHSTDTIISESRSFTTVDKVTLTSPANNATNVELTPTLTWQTITGIVSFELEIANNPEFNNLYAYHINSGGENTFKVPIHVLDSSLVYYWRVKAISSRDTSAYSDTWSFRCVTVGLDDNSPIRNGIKLYPVPASNKISIKTKSTINGLAEVEIYDLLGNKRNASFITFSNGVYKDFPVNNLTNGVYMMSIVVDGQRTTSKLIIQK